MTQKQFTLLKKFNTVSFSLWSPYEIEKNIKNLHSKVIIIGLNPSNPRGRKIKFLENFHKGGNDLWYKEAFSKAPFSGAFMMDLISEAETDSNKIMKKWKSDKKFRDKNIRVLKEKFKIIKANKTSKIFCLGKNTYNLFKNTDFDFSNMHYICHPEWYKWNKKTKKDFLVDVNSLMK